MLVLLLPLGTAIAFYVWLSYARFGTFTGVNYDYYINPVHSEFAHKYGVFSLRRIPYSFADYFSVRFPRIKPQPPFLGAGRHSYNYPTLFSNPDSEVYISLLWSSTWLVFAAVMGIVCLVRGKGVDLFNRGIAAALVVQFLCILLALLGGPTLCHRSLSFADLLSHYVSRFKWSVVATIASHNNCTGRFLGGCKLAGDGVLAG